MAAHVPIRSWTFAGPPSVVSKGHRAAFCVSSVPIPASLLVGALLKRQVGAVRLPDIPLPRVKARAVTLLIEANFSQDRVELPAAHSADYSIEIRRTGRLYCLRPHLNCRVGI